LPSPQDLDNAAGWFNIYQPVPATVLVVVFCGSGGVYGSLPRQPLIAGHVPENRCVCVCPFPSSSQHPQEKELVVAGGKRRASFFRSTLVHTIHLIG
jgi:hypothetical protein